MTDYKARDFQARALSTLTFEDGTKWTVRMPKGKDRHRLLELGEEVQERAKCYTKAAEANAETARADAEAKGEDGDTAARAYLDTVEDPPDVEVDYIYAETLAIFILPETEPAEVLKRISDEFDLDCLYELHERTMQALRGDAARDRVRSGAR